MTARRVTIGLALAVALSVPVVARQQTVFRASVDSVTVDVSVKQRGRPVADLGAGDFELRDLGVVQQVLDVSRESLPIDVTFVVDLSGSVQGPLLQGLTRALGTASRGLRATDRARLVTFNHRLRELRPLDAGPLPDPFPLGTPAGQTSLLDALAVSLIMPPETGRRRMVLVFTDGLDSTSFVEGSAVVDLAKRSQAAVFAVALTGGTRSKPARPAHEGLFTELTSSSGGTLTVLQGDDDLSASFATAFEEFRTSYVLRYSYDGPSRPGWHDLAVRVTRRGDFDVRARRGYFGG